MMHCFFSRLSQDGRVSPFSDLMDKAIPDETQQQGLSAYGKK